MSEATMSERIYRTADGRHVLGDDPDAAFLAYSQHDDPPPVVLEEIGAKMRRRHEDKAALTEAGESEKPQRVRSAKATGDQAGSPRAG